VSDSVITTEAHENFENLQLAIHKTANSLSVVAKLLYQAKYNKYYKALGYGSLAEYAAQSEIGLSSNVTAQLVSIYENFCVLKNVSENVLLEQSIFADYTKAYRSIPLLSKHSPEEVADIIHANSQSDIIHRVQELQGLGETLYPMTPIPSLGEIVDNGVAVTNLMTGQEWFDRFWDELIKGGDPEVVTSHRRLMYDDVRVIQAAKRASGIE
jgi:hypothetical protein